MSLHHKSILASLISGLLLGILYAAGIIPLEKNSILLSMILLSAAGASLSFTSGKRQGVLTFLLIGLIGCTIEGIGIATCRPYGCFSYSEILGPKFFNTFPFVLLGVRPFLAISIGHLVPKNFTGRKRIVLGTILLIILDLALDPVHIWQGIWSYNEPGINRFGVPLQNFIGWAITGGLSMIVLNKRIATITNNARQYAGISIMTLFRVQFILGLVG